MQLRSFRQLHYISFIKQGEVKKVPNVARGKPVLRFKSLEEIYADEVSATSASPVQGGAKACRHGKVGRANTQIKIEEEDNAASSAKRESFLDDFSNLTLKQLKEECRAKKRKASSSVKCAKQECADTEESLPIKQERVDTEATEDELHLDETLNSWKRRKLGRVSPCAESAASMSYEVQGDKGIRPCIMKSMSTKPEAMDTHCLTTQDTAHHLSGNSSSGGNTGLSAKTIQSGLNVTVVSIWLKLLDVAALCSSLLLLSQIKGPLSVNERSPCPSLAKDCLVAVKNCDTCFPSSDSSVLEESHACKLNQVQNNHPEDRHASAGILESTDMLEIVVTDNLTNLEVSQQEDVPDQMAYEGDAEARNARIANKDLPVSEESHVCELSLVSYYDVVEELESSQTIDNSHFKENSVDYNGDSVESYVPSCPVPTDRPSDAESSYLISREVHDLQICHNDEHKQTTYGNEEVVLPDMSSDNSSCVSSCDTIKISSQPLCAALEVNPSNYDSPVTMKSKSFTSDNHASERSFPGSHPSETTEEDSDSAAEGSCAHVEQQTSRRMLSGRKIISPNSQEELCKLMNSVDLQDEAEPHKCKKKLSFDEQVGSTVQLAEPELGSDSVKPRKASKKLSRCKKRLRTTKHSQESPRFSSGCNSIQSCSRSAVAFSQQQMRDFERLASKLTTELQSMKVIFVDALQTEPKTFATASYNTNEVRVAVEHATKLVETTQKWLSMMARDCNRFCKIMSLADENANSTPPRDTTQDVKGENVSVVSPMTIVQKKRKICFADEAGGTLCHVKLFESGPSPHLNELIKLETD